MGKHNNSEEPHHTNEYQKDHPHIHEVKYKGKDGKTKIYIYRYGTVRKGKNAVDKVKSR